MKNSPHELTADQLLAEADWMRTLARALARDPDAADELVQDTWLAALRRPPSTDRSLRPWLGAVMRNFARQRLRVRAHSEASSELRSELPSPQTLAERVELQQLVVRLVLDLPQPLKTTVLLRYFEGLEPAEIARRTREPSSTVRWRLKEGLDQVRSELDRRHGGERETWRAAFAPLLLDWKKPAAASSAAAVGLWLAAASVAIGAAVWLTRGADEQASIAAAPTPTVAAANSDETTSTQSTRRATAVVETPTAKPARAKENGLLDSVLDLVSNPRSSARVRFVDELDRPVSGVEFSGGASDQVFRTRSGGDGVAELETRALAGEVWADFYARDDAGRYWSHEQLVAAGDELDFGEVRLRPGCTLSGVARYEDGRVASGLEVVVSQMDFDYKSLAFDSKPRGAAFWSESETNRSGAFELTCLPEGPCAVWVGSPEYGWSSSGELVLAHATPLRDVVVVLKKWTEPAKVVVLVRDSAGKSVGLGSMRSKSEGGGGSSGTFRSGRIEFSGGRKIEELWVADRTGKLGAQHVENLTPRAEPYVVVLQPALRSWIEVVGVDGRALSEFQAVTSDAASEFEFPATKATGAVNGRASVVVGDQPFVVRVTARGYFVGEARFVTAAPENAPARIELEPLHPVQGRVVGPNGPAADVWVDVVPMLPRGEHGARNNAPVLLSSGPASSGLTDEYGRFSISVRKAGEYALVCRPNDLPKTTRMSVAIDPSQPRADFELHIGPGGSVEGLALFEDGEPMRKIPIGLSRGDFDIRTARTDDKGRFRFDGVAPGDWYVYRAASMLREGSISFSSSAAGRDPDWVHPTNCTVTEDDIAHVTLTLPRPTRFEIAVEASIDGDAALGWSTWLSPLRDLDPFDVREFGSTAYFGSDDRALVSGVGAGPWRLWASPPRAWDKAIAVFTDFDPSTDEVGPLTLETCELKGEAQLSGNRLMALWRLPNGWIAFTALKPNERGEFRILHAPVGPFSIVRDIDLGVGAARWELETLAESETRADEPNFIRIP